MINQAKFNRLFAYTERSSKRGRYITPIDTVEKLDKWLTITYIKRGESDIHTLMLRDYITDSCRTYKDLAVRYNCISQASANSKVKTGVLHVIKCYNKYHDLYE